MNYCPNCGAQLAPGAGFCPQCGCRTAAAPASPPPAPRRRRRIWIPIVVIAAVLVCAAAVAALLRLRAPEPGPSPAPTTEPTASLTITDAVESVLYLEMYDGDHDLYGTASGFITGDGRTLITNYHVLDGACYIRAMTRDYSQTYSVEDVLAFDRTADLAVLRLNKKTSVPALTLGDSDAVRQGDRVYAVGYPLGVANTLSDGLVSSRYNDDDGVDIIQMTAAISSGSSGGALLSETCEVVGVICATYVDGQNMNLAIASNTLKKLMDGASGKTRLEDFYAVDSAFGTTPGNLAGGCCVAEGENGKYYTVSSGRIYECDASAGGKRGRQIVEGAVINYYKGKLYFYNEEWSDLFSYNADTGNFEELYLLSGEYVSYKGEPRPAEAVTQMLAARGLLFCLVELYGDDGDPDLDFESYLIALDMYSDYEIVYVCDEEISSFTYFGDTIYAAVKGKNELRLISVKYLTEASIETPVEPQLIGASQRGAYFSDAELDTTGLYLCIPARGTAERVFDGYCTGIDSYVMDGDTIWQASVSFAGGSMNTDFIRLDCSGREPSAGYLGTFEGSFEFGEGGVFGGKFFSPHQNFALDLETFERISILNGKPMTD
ncbi:MAG: trypsin-like peptidase domain-containing protein [Oscillospiraceae bacterium]|nr:trypsin-like peptidase domain-containing protein [Oscillospiraceae bacterium]